MALTSLIEVTRPAGLAWRVGDLRWELSAPQLGNERDRMAKLVEVNAAWLAFRQVAFKRPLLRGSQCPVEKVRERLPRLLARGCNVQIGRQLIALQVIG
jgi:hypothetical protein